jgi:hypothetical protein
MIMVNDAQVFAALRAWWDLGPNDAMPWEDNLREKTSFREASIRDMRAALEAAQELKE